MKINRVRRLTVVIPGKPSRTSLVVTRLRLRAQLAKGRDGWVVGRSGGRWEGEECRVVVAGGWGWGVCVCVCESVFGSQTDGQRKPVVRVERR